jgi:alpha-L-rhamnosidase
VGDWLYQVVAGIELDPQRPGYSHFLLQPQPGTVLTSARGAHHSPHGEIVSSWKRTENSFEWEVTVPPNTSATARFPVPAGAEISEQGKPITESTGVTKGKADGVTPVFELASGTYQFHASWSAAK